MLSAHQITKIATMANTLIDVPLVSEKLEQAVFETAIRLIDEALDKVLPAQMTELLEDLTGKSELALDRAHSGNFIERLVGVLNEKVDIPFLGEQQEEKLIRMVIELLVKAMTSIKALDDFLQKF